MIRFCHSGSGRPCCRRERKVFPIIIAKCQSPDCENDALDRSCDTMIVKGKWWSSLAAL